MKKGKCK